MANLFLYLDGIDGESLAEDHPDEIELAGWGWGKGITNTASYKLGQDNAKEAASLTSVDNITFTKWCDKASVTLAQYCALGTPIPEGIITCRKNSGEEFIDYLVITMKNVMIGSVVWSVAQGEHSSHEVTETVVLNFEEFIIEYQGQGDDGIAQYSPPFKFHITKHENA